MHNNIMSNQSDLTTEKTSSFYALSQLQAGVVMFLIIFLCSVLAAPLMAQAEEDGYYTQAEQAFIFDYDTGMVLLNKNADEKMPTSSMSKIMTIYMVFEALEDGRITLNDKFRVSEKAWRKGGSKMFVEVGDEVRVEDLIRGVIVQSGNDATIVLAEGLAANEDKFAQEMTRKAHELGARNTNFVNASGWPNPDHYSTARDLAIIAAAMIRNFPQYYDYYSETEFTYNDITQRNRNPLLYQDIGADGLKTGHTEDAGFGLIGTGERDGRRVVMVVNGLNSLSERAKEGSRLLNHALRDFKNIRLFDEGEEIRPLPVVFGEKKEVMALVPAPITVTVPKGREEEITVITSYQLPLVAPVEQGQAVGRMTISVPKTGAVITPLIAGGSSHQPGFITKVFSKAKYLLTGGPELAVDE